MPPEHLATRARQISVAINFKNIDDNQLPPDLLRSVNQSRDKGASLWLTAVPLVDQGLVLKRLAAFKV